MRLEFAIKLYCGGKKKQKQEQKIKRNNKGGGSISANITDSQAELSELEERCRCGSFGELIESYISFCRGSGSEGGAKKETGRFPNYTGFCRYLSVSPELLEGLLEKYPHYRGLLAAILEDEALNSSVSPTVIAAYLKKRLGYERENRPQKELPSQLSIRFEHDIFADGE